MSSRHLDLNNPDTRQALLIERLNDGATLVARAISEEFDVSPDTIRRDLIALEKRGVARRVKGGAIPVKDLQTLDRSPMVQRVRDRSNWLVGAEALIAELTAQSPSLFLDGGTSVLFFARQLPENYCGLIITPSPLVAAVMLEKQIETVLIGGILRPSGGIATGAETIRGLSDCTADIAVLGTCGLDPRFGLSSDDLEEAAVKQTMARNADKLVVLATAERVNMKTRHRVVPCGDIDMLITSAKQHETSIYELSEIEVHNV